MEGGVDGRAVTRAVKRSSGDITTVAGVRGKWPRRKSGKAGGAVGAEGGVMEDGGERREGRGEVLAYGYAFLSSHLHF